MTYPTEDCWIVKIYTDSYAGNFEREMTAYATGCIGECGVGDDLAKLFSREVGYLFEDIILNVPDDHGCHRPCSLYEGDNTSVLIFFSEKPKSRHLKLIKERASIYATDTSLGRCRDEKPIQIIAFELIELAVDYRETSFPWEA